MSEQRNNSSNNRQSARPPRRGGPFGRGHAAMMRGEKARDFKGTMRKLVEYLGNRLHDLHDYRSQNFGARNDQVVRGCFGADQRDRPGD